MAAVLAACLVFLQCSDRSDFRPAGGGPSAQLFNEQGGSSRSRPLLASTIIRAVAVQDGDTAYAAGRIAGGTAAFQDVGQPAGPASALIMKIDLSQGRIVEARSLSGKGRDEATGIAIGPQGRLIVAGFTSSADFPERRPLFPGFKGQIDAFVAMLDPTDLSLLVSTCVGGAGIDKAAAIALIPGGFVIAGSTLSRDYPVSRAFQPVQAGSYDAMVTAVAIDGSRLLYSTYLGGRGWDEAVAVAASPDGAVYVTGHCQLGFPEDHAERTYGGGFSDAFVTALAPGGGSLVYSTCLGGSGWDFGTGIIVTDRGVAVAGHTQSPDFPMLLPFQLAIAGNDDVFVAFLRRDRPSLRFSSYLGGADEDLAWGIAELPNRLIAVTGGSVSSDLPILAPSQARLGGSSDAFLAVIDPARHQPLEVTYLGGAKADEAFSVAWSARGLLLGGRTCSPGFGPSVEEFERPLVVLLPACWTPAPAVGRAP